MKKTKIHFSPFMALCACHIIGMLARMLVVLHYGSWHSNHLNFGLFWQGAGWFLDREEKCLGKDSIKHYLDETNSNTLASAISWYCYLSKSEFPLNTFMQEGTISKLFKNWWMELLSHHSYKNYGYHCCRQNIITFRSLGVVQFLLQSMQHFFLALYFNYF